MRISSRCSGSCYSVTRSMRCRSTRRARTALEEVRKSWDGAYRRGPASRSRASSRQRPTSAILMLALDQRLGERPQSSRAVAKQMVALEERRLEPILAGSLGRRTASSDGEK